MSSELLRFESLASVADWSAIDDRVMGGVSRSRLRHDLAGHAVFEGIVSLEHNGGFASVRSRPLDLGIPRVLNYVLEVCGDGKRYQLNLRTDEAFDGVNYQAAFTPPAGIWMRGATAALGVRSHFPWPKRAGGAATGLRPGEADRPHDR